MRGGHCCWGTLHNSWLPLPLKFSLSPPRCEGGAPHHPLICHCVVAGSRPPLLVQSLLAGRDCGSTERVRQAGTEAVCSPPPLHTTTTHIGHITHWPWPWLWPWP